MKKKLSLGIIGGGVMGEVFVERITAAHGFGVFVDIWISDPKISRRRFLENKYSVHSTADNQFLVKEVDVLLLAVKPQQAEQVMKEIAEFVNDRLVISIMAGASIAKIRNFFHTSRIIRAMPNTPARFGQGMTVWYAYRSTRVSDRALAAELFSLFGREIQVKSERHIDMATAISGSGPAYVFYLAEILTTEAIYLGFSQKIARELVSQTLFGSASMLRQSEDNAFDLRKQVTSKGGTTEAALRVLYEKEYHIIWRQAIQAAYLRALKLGKK